MVRTLSKAPHPFKGTEIHQLKNGLTVLLKQDRSAPAVALQAWARCGAMDEEPRVFGISHGLEHMVFKGTAKRTAGDITRDIESRGGAINAATQLETTHYYIDIPSYGFDAALEVLADAMQNPAFPEDELERERKVILEEIHRRDDSPEATLWDEFASQVFSGTAYGTKVIGSIETVSALTRKDLASYFSEHYVGENLAVVVAGDINPKKVLKRIESLFSGVPGRKAPVKPSISLNGKGGSRAAIKKPVQLSYFAAGHPAPGLGHDDSVGLDLLADVLSGGTSARLYQKLREEKQLVFSLACDYIPFSQSGLFAFFGDALPEKLDDAVKALLEELDRLTEEPIRPEELQRAKARIKSDWLQGSETPHGQASTLGSLHSLGELPVIETYLARVDALTPNDLMQLARRHVAPSDLHFTHIVPESRS